MLQHQVLETLSGARNYIAWLADLAAPYLGEHPVEIGAGLGDYAERWLAAGVPRITLTEHDSELCRHLRRRFAADSRVTIRELDLLEAKPAEFTATVMLNVLEHLADDAVALRRAKTLSAGSGRIVVLVPAFEFAMGDFDRAIGHYPRYTKQTLGSAARRAGLSVDELRYVNAPGLLAWLVGVRWLRRRPHATRGLAAWDTAVVPMVRRLEERPAPPFGQSVLLVAH